MNIIKDGTVADRAWKVCRCGHCGRTAQCTPSCDFYDMPDRPEGYLLCDGCNVTRYAHARRKLAFGVPLCSAEIEVVATFGPREEM